MNIETKTAIKIGDKDYPIEYPRVGQIIEIENLKLMLSGNMYGALVKSEHSTGVDLLNLIDGIAYFTVLNKDFAKDFEADDFSNMDVVRQKQIKKAFSKVFWPWFTKINIELNKDDDEDESETK